MKTFTDHDLLLYTARLCVGVTESPPLSNRGTKVEEFLAAVGLKGGDPWCAAFVSWVGKQAWGKGWPLPMTGSTVRMVEAGAAAGFEKGVPMTGGLFFLWHQSLGRIAHVGFVAETTGALAARTYEGNTSGAGVRDGWGVFERQRTFGPKDRFLFFEPR